MRKLIFVGLLVLGFTQSSLARAQTFTLPIADNAIPAVYECTPGKIFKAIIDGVETTCQCPKDASGKILYPVSTVTPKSRNVLNAVSKARASKVRKNR